MIRNAVKITDRVSSAISEVQLQTSLQIDSMRTQVGNLKNKIINKTIKPLKYTEYSHIPKNDIMRDYGHRSIGKEIDQVVSTLRSAYSGDSYLVLLLTSSSSQEFEFDKLSINRFHKVVSKRSLTPPLICKGELTRLDTITLKGKFINSSNQNMSIIHFECETDILKVRSFLGIDTDMEFIGALVIEFDSLAPNFGDIYFIDILD
ncbi:MAG: hypothetical protein GY874_17550 [Desulfobacteraceae bacterium]|nr:hypothetical protein [Desulfobacteraceae bacterium]